MLSIATTIEQIFFLWSSDLSQTPQTYKLNYDRQQNRTQNVAKKYAISCHCQNMSAVSDTMKKKIKFKFKIQKALGVT